MGEAHPVLTTFYENWQRYQEEIRDALRHLTMGQLAMRPAPHLRPLGNVAAHINAARSYWFHGFLGEGGPEFDEITRSDDDEAPEPEAGRLVEAMDATWALIAASIAGWSEADLRQGFPRRYRGKEIELSRAWVIWHVLEHDLHHGGEVSLMLGMSGLRAPDI